MDISNTTMTSSVAPPAGNVAKAAPPPEAIKPVVTHKLPVTEGNSLPQERQAEAEPIDASVPKPTPEELQRLVDQANAAVQGRFSDLKFTVAEGTEADVIVRIEDSETGELIRQIPSEEMLAVIRAMDKLREGSMFEGKA